MVANEKQEFKYINVYYSLLDIGIEFRTGSKETIVNTNETNLTELTQRWGEVDYTLGRIFTLITTSSGKK